MPVALTWHLAGDASLWRLGTDALVRLFNARYPRPRLQGRVGISQCFPFPDKSVATGLLTEATSSRGYLEASASDRRDDASRVRRRLLDLHLVTRKSLGAFRSFCAPPRDRVA